MITYEQAIKIAKEFAEKVQNMLKVMKTNL